MGLLDSAADGTIGAVITGGISWLLLHRSRPSRDQYARQYAAQLDDVKRELAAAQADSDRERERYVSNLLGQIQAKDSAIAAMDRRGQAKDTEIARLQRELGRAQQGGRDV